MQTAASTHSFELTPTDNNRLALVCGQLDEHLKTIESYFDVSIIHRGHLFSINGNSDAANAVENVLRQLYTEADKGLDAEVVHLAITRAHQDTVSTDAKQVPGDSTDEDDSESASELTVRTRKSIVRGQNARQRAYIRNILTHTLTFGVGPAGTGKTYLAVACATNALLGDEVKRIVLVRPAVEAGERLGFLPGDIGQKVDPYLRPLYDALYEMLGFEKVARLMDKGVIELAPLAYMRGRTLNESFVILDEAQNTTQEQMKMFLTRTGFNSRVVITGDVTQIDLPRGVRSGLKHAVEVLQDIDDISFTRFTPKDVVRHAMVQRIVEAYEAFEDEDDH